MATPQPKSPVRRDPERAGIMLQILKGLKLKIRLLKDPRVSGWLKLGFVAGFLWVVFPDLIVGPLDDVLVFYFLANFEDFCPQWVVREVLAQMEEEEKGNRPQGQKKATPGNSNKERPTGRFLANMGGDPVFFTREEDIPEGVAVWQEFVDRAGQKKWRRYR
ncbi:MAG: hypothetical protein CH104c_0416 [Candidatus Woesebacteria bacterium]|jgi:hypothetical protein|nr:MAG: hypothetical protein CH104c_0416 [Candidatus Woesebacteria bacterium]